VSTKVEPPRSGSRKQTPPSPGMAGPVAALLVFVVSGIAGSIDVFTGPGLRLLFTICLIASTAVAAALVRRGDLLWVVLAPPLICLALAMVNVLTTAHSATGLTMDYLAHGFPAIAIAVGLAALIGGIRLLNRK
jgi:hypothetical protein